MDKTGEIKVWDLFVRFFHWTLAASFFIAYVTEDELIGLHLWAGYLVFSLVILRIAWGVVGTPYARFNNFVHHPGKVIGYIKELTRLEAPRHIGHNPAGGAMIVLLLGALALTSLSGMVLYGAETGAGFLGDMAISLGIVGEAGVESFEEVHELFANLTLFLVALHLAGVLFESLLHRENLVRSMISGRKQVKINE